MLNFKRRFWPVGITLLTTLGLILGSYLSVPPQLAQQAVQAQVPSPPGAETPVPTPEASPEPLPRPPAPTPDATPSPLPPPEVPSPEPIPEVEEPTAPPLPVGGTYEDPNGFYQVAILEGYKVSSTSRSPLFESPDGDLAYTVLRLPRITKQRLTDGILAQIAIEELTQGEGFVATEYSPVAEGTVQVPWTGTLTQGRSGQPMSGVILSSQPEQDVFLVLIAATETGAEQVPNVVSTLLDGLEVTAQ
ncbi:hypothetical protein [Roseofilum casamattae]|uniref:Serine/threonine protein kinase n=1 Tax=Roseofilum casamattae BLCC-M143 TaxID=3022442 RepID=A0ABT7BUW6_9CYAN|nr:hypothetical protein [Roseofilum casamattae]MDJ1182271.1 hypothetical protein [Roseofilum casamattae BLCC-M143]